MPEGVTKFIVVRRLMHMMWRIWLCRYISTSMIQLPMKSFIMGLPFRYGDVSFLYISTSVALFLCSFICLLCLFYLCIGNCKLSSIHFLWPPSTLIFSIVLPPFQIISHSKNLGESKHLKFDQNYRENYKNL